MAQDPQAAALLAGSRLIRYALVLRGVGSQTRLMWLRKSMRLSESSCCARSRKAFAKPKGLTGAGQQGLVYNRRDKPPFEERVLDGRRTAVEKLCGQLRSKLDVTGGKPQARRLSSASEYELCVRWHMER